MRTLPILAVLAALAAAPAFAEKADRFKPLNVEADQPGRIDLLNQHVVFNGNVVVTKGTMTIRAGRIEVRETPDGYHSAVAIGIGRRQAASPSKSGAPGLGGMGWPDSRRAGKHDDAGFIPEAGVAAAQGR